MKCARRPLTLRVRAGILETSDLPVFSTLFIREETHVAVCHALCEFVGPALCPEMGAT
jgi:hypothetical protein